MPNARAHLLGQRTNFDMRPATDGDRKFVTTKPSEDCVGAPLPNDTVNCRCNGSNDQVAGIVTMHIINRLKAIEIDHHDRDRMILPVGAATNNRCPLEKRPPIENAAQWVSMGENGQLR